jgi:hypothetical protein
MHKDAHRRPKRPPIFKGAILMKKRLAFLLALCVLGACEGPMGPAGPSGAQGPTGPQGPAGPGANYWVGQGTADVDGFYAVRFANQQLGAILAQCWTRDTPGPWVQLASAGDATAPNGVIGCVTQQDGADVVAAAATYAFWEVLIVAVAVN